jgi:hypothetical protein
LLEEHPELVVESVPSLFFTNFVKIIVQTRVVFQVINRCYVIAVGLKHVSAIGILVDIVEIA